MTTTVQLCNYHNSALDMPFWQGIAKVIAYVHPTLSEMVIDNTATLKPTSGGFSG